MTALIRLRLRLSGRALSSLGLLMMAVVIGLGATGSGVQGSVGSAPGAVISGSVLLGAERPGQPPSERPTVSTSDGASMSAGTTDRPEFGLLPQHIRRLAGAVILIGLAGVSQQYWIVILGLGLYASVAADRSRLRRLFSGCRHGTRAPPLCS